MELSVIIVNYNVKYFLEQALLSVVRASAQNQKEVFHRLLSLFVKHLDFLLYFQNQKHLIVIISDFWKRMKITK